MTEELFVYEFISAGGLGDCAPASLLREGGAMLASLLADFATVPNLRIETLVLDDFATKFADPRVRIVPCRPETQRSQFVECLRCADVALIVAPEFEGILQASAEAALGADCRLLGCTPAGIAATADKLALARHWHAQNVPTPTTRCMGEGPARFPCVVKPRHGAGSQATFLVKDADAWEAALAGASEEFAGELIVQSYHAGLAVSVAFLIGPNRVLPLLPARQLLSSEGRFHYQGGEIPIEPNLCGRAVDLASRAILGIEGLHGYVGVDLVLGENADRDVVLEINPRLTTSYIGYRALAKSNLAQTWWNLMRETPTEPIVWHESAVRFTAAGEVALV